MAKYLRLFENHQEYESFTETEEFIKPNVSYCEQENEVHYNGTPYVTVINVENIVKNSTTDESHAMISSYEDNAFSYGTTYSNINPTFYFDGYEPILEGESLEGLCERYATNDINYNDNKGYIYRNLSTDEWFFYCNGDRGGSIYWVWAFSEKCNESDTFCTKYVPNKAYIKTNVNTPPILLPNMVSFNGVAPNGVLSGNVKTVTVVLDKAFDFTKYIPDIVSINVVLWGENIGENTIVYSDDKITWTGEFDTTVNVDENVSVGLYASTENGDYLIIRRTLYKPPTNRINE